MSAATQVAWDYDRTDPPPFKRRIHVDCGGSVTFENGRPHCHRCGKTDDNGGWIKKLLMWHWHAVSLDGYPGWDLEGEAGRRHPPFVKLRIKNKVDKSSSDIANEWDDLSEGLFYGRDWSDDGSVFVNEGETYTSGFWFQKTSDAERFIAKYGGVRE